MAKQNGNNNGTPKKVYRSIEEYANTPVDYSSLYRPIVTGAGYGSKYDEGFVGSPFGNNEMRLAADRAASQGFWAEAGTALARIPFDIALGLVESIGYIGDVPEWTNLDKDYGNWLSDAMKAARERISQDYIPTYERSPGDLNFNDSAFYWNNLSSLASSVAQFAALGAGVGSVLGKVASSLAGAYNASRGTAMALEGFSTLGNAAVLTYTEAKMNSLETYESVKQQAIDSGYTLDQAEDVAARSADHVEKINMGNILLNLTGASMITKGLGVVGKEAKEIAKRTGRLTSASVSNETARKAMSFLNDLDDIPVRITSVGNTLKKGLLESVQEYAEETIGYVGQQEGTYKAQRELGLVAESEFGSRLGEYLTSAEGITQGVLGAIGGIGQAALVTHLANLRGSRTNTEAQFQQYVNVLRENKDNIDLMYNIKRQGDLANKLSSAAVANDENRYEEAQNQVLMERFFDSKLKGLEEGLIRQLNTIANMSSSQAVEAGYAENEQDTSYRDKALDALRKVGEWDNRFNRLVMSNPNSLRYEISNKTAGTSQLLAQAILAKQAEVDFFSNKVTETFNEVNEARSLVYSSNPDKSQGAKNIAITEAERDVFLGAAMLYEQAAEKLKSNSDINASERQIKGLTDYSAYLGNRADLLNRRILELNSTYLGEEEKTVNQDKELIQKSGDIERLQSVLGSYIHNEYRRRTAAEDYDYMNSDQFIQDKIKDTEEAIEREALETKKAEKLRDESAKKERVDEIAPKVSEVEDAAVENQRLENVTADASKKHNVQEATADGQYMLKDRILFISDDGELEGVITNISGDILAVLTDDGRTWPVHISAITGMIKKHVPDDSSLAAPPTQDENENIEVEVGVTDHIDQGELPSYQVIEDTSSMNSTAFKGVAGIARINKDGTIVINDIVRTNRTTPIDDKYRDNPNTVKIGDQVRLEVEVSPDNYNRSALENNTFLAIDIVKYDSDGNRHVIDVLNSGANSLKVGVEQIRDLRNDITNGVKNSDQYKNWNREDTFVYQFPKSFSIVDKYVGIIERTDKFSTLNEIYESLVDPRNGNQMPVILGVAFRYADSPAAIRIPNLSRYDLTMEDITVDPEHLTPGAVYSVIPMANGRFTVARLFTRAVNEEDLSQVVNIMRSTNLNNLDDSWNKINQIIPLIKINNTERRFNIKKNKNNDQILVYLNNNIMSLEKFIDAYEKPGGPQRLIEILAGENKFHRQVSLKNINTGKYNEQFMDGALVANLPTDGVVTIYGNVVLEEYNPTPLAETTETTETEETSPSESPASTSEPDLANIFALPQGVTELEEGGASAPPAKPASERRRYTKREGAIPTTSLNPIILDETNQINNANVSDEEVKETKNNCKGK